MWLVCKQTNSTLLALVYYRYVTADNLLLICYLCVIRLLNRYEQAATSPGHIYIYIEREREREREKERERKR